MEGLIGRSSKIMLQRIQTKSIIKPNLLNLRPHRSFSYSVSAKLINSNVESNEQKETSRIPLNLIHSEILRASLSFVPKYGWSVESLSHGANSLGYPSVSHGLFPRGGVELIEWFLEDSRRKMVNELIDKMDGLKIHQKIRLACITRLNYTKPYAKKWSEALAIMAQPNNVQTSIEHLAKLVDDMWYLAGDKSADMNWYTKRGSLAVIYSSTELYMTQDISPDYTGTFQFLDHRLQDIATFGRVVGEIDTFVGFVTKSLVGVLASKGIGNFDK
ncbi:ubiquinone biosynthesis protein COQ9 [Gigaspora margarita]|uniref:Ubiquinone biosynthesis protein n=1 Tax=Gigaspora margarita TaxID=4874 RepID=A0A8H4ETM0_GIGMA|nr:ubiquinone biosynthesis protein COQ9 [Gigaspora margarita]